MKGLLYSSLVVLSFGCASPGTTDGARTASRMDQPRDDSNFITREEIARSKARNGWDALRLNAGHLMLSEGRAGDESAVKVQHRGVDSLFQDDRLILVVDGRMTPEMILLRELPASTIQSIQILTPSRAVLRFGSEAGGGAIVVTTLRGGRRR